VSSNVLKAIAEKEGFMCEDTLTGFKWMGNRASQLLAADKRVLFCFEEAIGFMCGTNVLDKDGISAEAVLAEMAVYLQQVEKRTLLNKLDWIYENYGYHVSNNSYFLCYEKENIEKMFYKIRHWNSKDKEDEFSYPSACGPYKINQIRDLTAGLFVDLKNNGKRTKPNFPTSKSSHMITFYFENSCTLTIRTSGTEPKIKWYSEIRQTDMSKSRQQLKCELDDLIKHVIEQFYEPERNNLKARSST
jgi:phosphoglucomutase/phosphopentomutase